MNVTENEKQYCQSQTGNSLQKDTAEQGKYVGEYDSTKELEGRGHRFVRYADDLVIFCKSKRSATRTLENILPFIEGKLFLKVNREKTVVDYVGKVKFLGFSFYQHK